MNQLNSLQSLRESCEGAEIWWDSCPMAYGDFRDKLLSEQTSDFDSFALNELIEKMFNPALHKTELCGVTTNPNLVANEIDARKQQWAQVLLETQADDPVVEAGAMHDALYSHVIRRSAAVLKPIWDRTEGEKGWVCAQLCPQRAHDVEAMLNQGRRLASCAENVMVKVPVTETGLRVIETLTAEGIATNGTFSFSVSQALAFGRAVHRGRKVAIARGLGSKPWRSVSTFMIGRFEYMGDMLTEAQARGVSLDKTDIGWAGAAIAKRIHALFEQCDYPVKLLLSSMSSSASDFIDEIAQMHINETRDGNIVYTCKPALIRRLAQTSELRLDDRRRSIRHAAPEPVIEKLKQLPYFARSFDPLGYEVDQFRYHPAFINTAREALDSTRQMFDFVIRTIQPQRSGLAS